MDILIINGELSNPPSESLAFRFLTLSSRYSLKLHNLIEVEKDIKDFYYSWLRSTGLYDFIEEIVTPEEKVIGISIGPQKKNLVSCDRVTFGNVKNLLGKIECCSLLD